MRSWCRRAAGRDRPLPCCRRAPWAWRSPPEPVDGRGAANLRLDRVRRRSDLVGKHR
jgi:hypothetical protein